jgi:hypothetical protein
VESPQNQMSGKATYRDLAEGHVAG